jgi:hypothetical protein
MKRKRPQQKDAELPPKIKSDEGESPARKTKRPRDKDPKEKGQHRGKKHRGEDDTGKKN